MRGLRIRGRSPQNESYPRGDHDARQHEHRDHERGNEIFRNQCRAERPSQQDPDHAAAGASAGRTRAGLRSILSVFHEVPLGAGQRTAPPLSGSIGKIGNGSLRRSEEAPWGSRGSGRRIGGLCCRSGAPARPRLESGAVAPLEPPRECSEDRTGCADLAAPLPGSVPRKWALRRLERGYRPGLRMDAPCPRTEHRDRARRREAASRAPGRGPQRKSRAWRARPAS